LTHTTHQIIHKLTPLHSPPPQQGKGKAPAPPPRPPPIEEEAPEEGDDPNFVSDTNNLITIKQNGPTLREIRDTDMGAAITYLLLDLEGVDTEPDILDDGKKGPWTIFATADCEEQFKAKYRIFEIYGDKIVLTFSEIPIEFTITYGEIQTKKGAIYKRTLERYTTPVMAKAFTIRAIIHARERSGATHPQRLYSIYSIGPTTLLAPSSASTPPAPSPLPSEWLNA